MLISLEFHQGKKVWIMTNVTIDGGDVIMCRSTGQTIHRIIVKIIAMRNDFVPNHSKVFLFDFLKHGQL